jgi:hypothetical protein
MAQSNAILLLERKADNLSILIIVHITLTHEPTDTTYMNYSIETC